MNWTIPLHLKSQQTHVFCQFSKLHAFERMNKRKKMSFLKRNLHVFYKRNDTRGVKVTKRKL